MALALRVIVTRPAAQARVWLQGLQQHGLEAESFPLIEIAPALQPAALTRLQHRVFESEELNACMWVSANAVNYFFQENKAFSDINKAQAAIKNVAIELTENFFKLRHWATGPGTVQALLAHGIAVEQIDSPSLDAGQWDSESLWEQVRIQVHAGTRLLILRGEDLGTPGAGREWLADQVGSDPGSGRLLPRSYENEGAQDYKRFGTRIDNILTAMEEAHRASGTTPRNVDRTLAELVTGQQPTGPPFPRPGPCKCG